jgi:glutamine amidotransferase
VKTVAIFDYGVGNMHSIRRGIEMAGASAKITTDKRDLRESDAIVLPGVGAFKPARDSLEEVSDLLKKEVEDGKPLLGVCLGMQLLFDWSEEGDCPGLGLIGGEVVKLSPGVKVPHMGWNSLDIEKKHWFLDGIKSGSHVYFVHSYTARPGDPRAVLCTTDYGGRFPSIVASGSVVGTQFHPEKSGDVGLRMLSNFVGGIG